MTALHLLLTGATGYLGSKLAHAYAAGGHSLSIIKRSTSDTGRLAGLDYQAFDVDKGELAGAFDPLPDAVIHTATSYGRKGEGASEMLETNTLFPLRLLEGAAAAGVKAFINTATALEPDLNAYALSKNHFAEWGRLYSDKLAFLNVKLEHFYGPDDDVTKFLGFVISALLRNQPDLPLTAGEQVRDFIYIDDAVRAYERLLEHALEAGTGYQDVALGSGEGVTIADLVGRIHHLTGSQTRLGFGALPYRAREAMYSVADITPLAALGWKPETDLHMGLEQTVAFYKTQDTIQRGGQ